MFHIELCLLDDAGKGKGYEVLDGIYIQMKFWTPGLPDGVHGNRPC